MRILRILAVIKLILFLCLVGLVVAHLTLPASHPNPNPDPPGPVGSLRVLIVEETAERSKLPPAQLLALTSGDVRDYLDGHCAKDAGAPAWRLLDKDTDVSNETPEWQSEFAVVKAEAPPAIAIKSGRRWTKPQPLPKDTDSLLKLLKKYGGA